jgi:hypothetical protein
MDRTTSKSRREPRPDHARLQRVLIALALAAGCSHTPTPQQRWFADRGRESTTWYGCLRAGAALRAECGTDAACATAVTEEMTRPCYAAHYHATASQAKPQDRFPPEQLSPCFWDDDPTHPPTPAAYAERTCSTVVEARLQPACVAELREVIEGVCQAGAPDLTGTGP